MGLSLIYSINQCKIRWFSLGLGLGLGVWGYGLGFGVWGLGLGFGVLGFGVWGLGCVPHERVVDHCRAPPTPGCRVGAYQGSRTSKG